MKAALYRGPRDLSVIDVDDPRDQAADEAILRVRLAGICGTDATEWSHGPVLARPPVVLGHEFVGEVVEPARDAGRFGAGRRVVSGAGVWCGSCEWCRRGRPNLCSSYRTLGLHVDGGLAHYVRVPERTLVAVPDELPDDAAAMAQPVAVALHALDRSGVRATESCAILGVGGIGAFLVAGAAARGVTELIALDIDDARLATAQRLGASRALNVANVSAEEAIRDATDGKGADVIIEATGTSSAPADALAAVKRGGRVLIVGLQARPTTLDLLAMTVKEVEMTTTLAHVCDVNLPAAVELLAGTDLAAETKDGTIPMSNLVDGGIRPLADRTARGKVLVDPWT